VGLEIEVTSIQGKAKMSQNRPEIDHDNVREHFTTGSWSEQNVALRMNLDE
jgi:predicted FMN-binding regulatory protein PaiB